jgi:hypothetical protein
MPSARPFKPRSNEVVFVVFLVRWSGRRGFQNTNLCIESGKWPWHHMLTWRSWKDNWDGRFLETWGLYLTSTTTGGGRPHEDLQAPASGPSIEPDTIDNLAQPTTCILMLLVRGSFWMEVRRGLVYPRQIMLDNVQIDTSSYAMVKVDMMHDNLKNLKLEVPPDDMTLSMWHAVARRVQWRRTSINIDLAATASASTSHALMSPKAHLPPSPNPEQLVLSPVWEQLPQIIEKPHKSPIRDQSHPSPILELL